MQFEEIVNLVKEVAKARLSNFEYDEGNLHISMSCQQETPNIEEFDIKVKKEQKDEQAAPQEKTNKSINQPIIGETLKSPLVGTFYAAPSEDAPAFVKVGDSVKKGQTVAIVEAMKLMNEIESEWDGIVTEICVKNEENVEYGQPLMRIEPL